MENTSKKLEKTPVDRREVAYHWTVDKRVNVSIIAALAAQIIVGAWSISAIYTGFKHDITRSFDRISYIEQSIKDRTVDRYTRNNALSDIKLLNSMIDANKESIKQITSRIDTMVIRIEDKLDIISSRLSTQ